MRWLIPLLAGPYLEQVCWSPYREGVEIHDFGIKPGDATQPLPAALLRYRPGASVPRHRHGGFEYILVLRGSQRDDAGEYGSGSLLVSAPGSEHTVESPEGCVVLAFWQKPVTFVALGPSSRGVTDGRPPW